MKMVKSLLLGSAAGLVAVAGAQAADLPVKAKPVEYVKICTLYGAGYYYIPGSDTCIKIGGYIRADYGWNVGGARTPAYSGTQGAHDRTVSEFSTRHRANVQIDTRTQTQYGTLRTLTSLHFQNENISESFNLARGFIQWAGFTFGHAVSYSDTWGISDSWHFAQQQNNSDTGANGTNLIAYTWELGNGYTLSVGADERRTKALTNLSKSNAITVGAEPGNSFAGERWPDLNVSFKVDQAWGYWAVAAVAHDLRATYYNSGTAPCLNPVPTAVAPVTANTPSGSNLISCGSPGDTWGWGVMTGAEIRLPFITPGDRFGFNVRYAEGASGYGGGSNLSSADLFSSGNRVAVGFITDGIYLNGTNIQKTTTWTIGAGYEHNWTENFKSSFTGAYSAVRYNQTAKGYFATNVCPATVTAQAGINTLANCDPDYGFFQGGVRTMWTPVSGFFLGLDVFYTHIWTAFGGSTPQLNGVNLSGTSGAVTPLNVVVGGRQAGTYTTTNLGTLGAVFRAQRNYNAGD